MQYQCPYCFFHLNLLFSSVMDIRNHMIILMSGLEYLLRWANEIIYHPVVQSCLGEGKTRSETCDLKGTELLALLSLTLSLPFECLPHSLLVHKWTNEINWMVHIISLWSKICVEMQCFIKLISVVNRNFLFLLQSFTMFAYISSYMWTLFYSLDVCLQVHNRQSW